MLTNPRPRWLLVLRYALAVATVLGCSSVAFVYFGMNAFGRTYPLGRAIVAGLVDWYFWAAVTPLVFWLGERYRLERSSWGRAAAIHLAAGTAVALLEILTVTAVGRWVHMTSVSGPFLDAYTRMILQYFHFNFIIYWVIVAAAHAARYYASASQLRAELTQAQLIALQMQLQPHFLFNALHTVAALVREGRAEQATDTVARLGDLLRRTLGDGDRYETPLADELGFVQAYLDIEQMRFSDRLVVTYDVPGEAAHAVIPRMALQPLAENAIRHGIARDPDARSVVIRARRSGDRLRLEVENDGPRWERDRDNGGSGVGLANVRARLSRLYGSAFRLDMLPGQTGGALAILEIPWRSAS